MGATRIRVMTFSVILVAVRCAGALEPATWGNVSGRILTSGSAPLADARICVPDRFCAASDSSGAFLLSGVPLRSWDGDTLDLDVSSPRGDMRLRRLLVPPGSMLAPRLEIAFEPGTIAEAADHLAPASLSPSREEPSGIASRAMALPHRIFATREGLVGFTTANGRTIQFSDHFVALPSRRALNRTDKPSDLEFEVEVAYGSKTVRLPVWDVGPWNTKDDWWNPSPFRQTLVDSSKGPLPQGTPQAQAAYLDGYNQGLDGSNRVVKNPAGIDLADGAFWNDLGMLDNADVQVRPLWRLDAEVGTSVMAKQAAKVRSTPKGAVADSVACGHSGRIVAGPDSATVANHWYLFYKVEWNDGTTGWSTENVLSSTGSAPCTEAVLPRSGTTLARLEGNAVRLSLAEGRSAEIAVSDPVGRILGRSGPLRATAIWTLPGSTGIQFIEVRTATHRQILTRTP